MDCSASAVNASAVNGNITLDKDCVQVNEDESKDPKVGTKRVRNTSSSVWNYFHKVIVGSDGKERAQCKACGREYVSGGNKYGTSTLLRHISKCEKVPKGFANKVGKLMLDQQGKLKARKVDQKIVRDMLSIAIIEHDLPFSFVEYKRIRELLKYLCPDVKIPSRRAATIDVINMYDSEKRKLKMELSQIPSRDIIDEKAKDYTTKHI
ncbi:Zinc finger, BED-type [Sesbania bispinosa]|nr:Zinc finger, BED-type [Sesbania bispinosa]